MNDEIFKNALNAARQTLADLERRQTDLEQQEAEISNELIEIEAQKTQLKETITSLSKLCGVPYSPLIGERLRFGALTSLGLSEAIREILKNNPSEKFYPLEVRERLIAGGFPVSQHNNIMASIHTALKRISSGLGTEIMETKKEGKPAYQWFTPTRRLSTEPSIALSEPTLGGKRATSSGILAQRIGQKDKK